MLQGLHLDVAKVDLDVTYILSGVGDPRGFPYACGKWSGRRWSGHEEVVGSTCRGVKKQAARMRHGYSREAGKVTHEVSRVRVQNEASASCQGRKQR
jgi:hypothetical protein